MLNNFLVDQNAISFYACAIQLSFFSMFTIKKFLFFLQCLMTVMWPSVNHSSTLSSCDKQYGHDPHYYCGLQAENTHEHFLQTCSNYNFHLLNSCQYQNFEIFYCGSKPVSFRLFASQISLLYFPHSLWAFYYFIISVTSMWPVAANLCFYGHHIKKSLLVSSGDH